MKHVKQTIVTSTSMVVVWFQEDLSRTIADFAAAAVYELAWEDLAEDTER